jgi:hypothetical protein
MIRKITLNFYSDPGHGWVKTPRTLLKQLGIASQISPYSYQRGDSVYVEEDSDLYSLINAMKQAGVQYQFRDFVSNRPSKIRGYAGYQAA